MSRMKIEEISRRALVQVDAAQRRFRLFIALAALVEGALLITFLLIMNHGDRLHWLLLVSALLVYSTLAVGLFALGAHNNVNTLRILKALDLATEQDG